MILMVNVFKMIVTYYPHSKNNQNLKNKELKFIRNLKYFSKISNFKSLFLPHVNGV